MNKKSNLPFDNSNYKIMIAGVICIAIGFIVMSLDQEDYGFGISWTYFGPIIVLSGFIIEFFAIFYNPKN